jgi:hypothetical protein
VTPPVAPGPYFPPPYFSAYWGGNRINPLTMGYNDIE